MRLVEREEAAPERPSLRRVQHPGRIVAFGTVTLLLVVGAFVGGSMVRAPQAEALRNVDQKVQVRARVEQRVVSDTFTLPAVVVPGASVDVVVLEAPHEAAAAPPPTDGGPAATTAPVPVDADSPTAQRVVVSRVAISTGATLAYGALVGEVSGRPVFAWPSTVPLFRDISVGMRGSDVRAVQQALADMGYRIQVDGVFGSGSLGALRALYRASGYDLPHISPGVEGLAWRELVGVPTGDGLVEYTAPLGSVLTAEAPLLRVRTTPPAFESQATSVELDRLAVGSEVAVMVGGAQPVQSSVVSVGAFVTDEKTGASGYPVHVAIPDGLIVDASTPVQIQPWEQPAPTTAVPTVALRQEGETSFVLVSPGDRSTKAAERVEVVVTAQADGWVGIEPNDKLPVGTEVLVSP